MPTPTSPPVPQRHPDHAPPSHLYDGTTPTSETAQSMPPRLSVVPRQVGHVNRRAPTHWDVTLVSRGVTGRRELLGPQTRTPSTAGTPHLRNPHPPAQVRIFAGMGTGT